MRGEDVTFGTDGLLERIAEKGGRKELRSGKLVVLVTAML